MLAQVMAQIVLLLAQAEETAPASAATPWWHVLLDNALALTVLFIFVTAIVSAIVVARKKDKCVKLLHDYHVTFLTAAGRAMWGDLAVYSQGVELRFDAPHTTRRGLTKSSVLIYEQQMADCLALCRLDDGLTEQERSDRLAQINRSFDPGPLRRTARWYRNMVNTLRDAFSKAFSALLGHMAKARPGGAMLGTHKGSVDQIGQTLLGSVAHAYEPMLEKHIGKPVVLELAAPADSNIKPLEMPGYLVEYTDQFLAVFNVEHQPLETFELPVSESTERAGVKVALDEHHLAVTATGPELLLVHTVASDSAHHDLNIALTPGCSVNLARPTGEHLRLKLALTRQVDIVCPRSLGTIHHSGEPLQTQRHQAGLAPQQEQQ